MKKGRADPFKLTDREIVGFVHNAQLALCDLLPDSDVPAAYSLKTDLLALFSTTHLTHSTLAAAFVSAAFDIVTRRWTGGDTVQQTEEGRTTVDGKPRV